MPDPETIPISAAPSGIAGGDTVAAMLPLAEGDDLAPDSPARTALASRIAALGGDPARMATSLHLHPAPDPAHGDRAARVHAIATAPRAGAARYGDAPALSLGDNKR